MISVVIPIFNLSSRFALFQQAVTSVRLQTYQQFEIIAVDDASTDDSLARAQAYLAEAVPGRFRTVSVPVNSGPSVARNLGIEESRGEIVAFLDWDDLYFPTFLEDAVAAMQPGPDRDTAQQNDNDTAQQNRETVEWVLAPAYFFRQKGREQKVFSQHFEPGTNSAEFYRVCAQFVAHNFPTAMGSALAIKRDVFVRHPELRFDVYLSKLTAEDVLFGYAMLKAGIRPYVLPRTGAVHRGFLEQQSRSTAAFRRIDETEVDRYINSHAADDLIELVRQKDALLAADLEQRRARRHDLFLLKRHIIHNHLLPAAGVICSRPSLAKVAVLYGLNKCADVPGVEALLQTIDFSRITNEAGPQREVNELLASVS